MFVASSPSIPRPARRLRVPTLDGNGCTSALSSAEFLKPNRRSTPELESFALDVAAAPLSGPSGLWVQPSAARAAPDTGGDFVVVALQGDDGKPRPALVLQSDLFGEHPSVTIAPVTSSIVDAPLFRVTIKPSPTNGLRAVSQIMVDKVTTVRRDRISQTLGSLPGDAMLRVNRAVVLWFGLAA